MDRVAVEQQIDAMTELLPTLTPGTKEYSDLTASIRNLQDALLREETYEQNRIKANMELDLKEKELDLKEHEIQVKNVEIMERTSQEKTKSWLAFAGATIGGLAAIGTAVIGALSRRDTIRELRELKEDQGIVDRDLVNLTR